MMTIRYFLFLILFIHDVTTTTTTTTTAEFLGENIFRFENYEAEILIINNLVKKKKEKKRKAMKGRKEKLYERN